MTIINPMKCKKCEEELQPEDLLVGTNEKEELVKVCRFCGLEAEVK